MTCSIFEYVFVFSVQAGMNAQGIFVGEVRIYRAGSKAGKVMEQGRVLIIDDEEIVRLNLGAYFQDEGYLVYAAESAEEALDMLPVCKPDFAVVDMRLPGMCGEDFIRTAAKHTPELRCIVYTAAVGYELPDDLRVIGMSSGDVFIKPVVEMNLLTGRLAAQSKM